MKRRFVIGDIHGEYEKFLGVLKLVNFDYKNDLLISLGDVVDRGLKSYECVEELLKIKNLIAIRGNHDATFRDSTINGINILYNQGGRETMLSYQRNYEQCDNNPTKIPFKHYNFFHNIQINYYIDEFNNLFVHGGFNRHKEINKQEENVYYWDRDLFLAALSYKSMKKNNHPFKTKTKFNKIFVGHTPTPYWETDQPIQAANIWNIDTGCGKGNYPLTIMNIDTEEYFQYK